MECYKEKHRRIALADLLLRAFGQAISEGGRRHAIVSRPGQEILERSTLVIREKDGQVLVRFEVGFPAAGRSIRNGVIYHE